MAKILEAAWSRAAVTRNALPFFLPLKLASVCVPVPDGKTRVSAVACLVVGTLPGIPVLGIALVLKVTTILRQSDISKKVVKRCQWRGIYRKR